MLARELKPGIFWVGVNDRTTDLFEGLWPITQEGVTYNSYLVKGEKTALIDLTKSIKGDEFLSMIEELTDVSKIDYIIINHMEPDHTGLLRTFRKLAPRAEILGSAKTKEMLRGFFGIEDGVRAVADGETLSLGGSTLKFLSTPFVHWPETIMTYEESQKVLFPAMASAATELSGGRSSTMSARSPTFMKKKPCAITRISSPTTAPASWMPR